MNLGATEEFVTYVLRYGEWDVFSDGHETAEAALAHAVEWGWSANLVEVVRVQTIRTRAAAAIAQEITDAQG